MPLWPSFPFPRKKWCDIYSKVDARLGNLYIDATPTLGFRIGKFNKLAESVGTDNSILSNSSGIELFLQSAISGTVHIYDATAQGNIFNNNFQYRVDDLNTFSSVITQSVFFATRKFSFGIEHYFTLGKVVTKERHVYARSILKYKF